MDYFGAEKEQTILTSTCECLPNPAESLGATVDVAIGGGWTILAMLAKVVWASPWSLWGLMIGLLGLATGGRVQFRAKMVEFWGGWLPLFLRYFPFIAGSPVATFGHVVVGRSQRHLEACRPHQLIHVRQYECWGPLFVPIYLVSSGVLWCLGKRPYYDNPFEREAFDATR